MSQTIFTAVPPESQAFRGVIIRRLCAFAIDAVLMGLAGWLLAGAILVFGLLTFGFGFLMFHIIPAVPFAYFTLFLVAGGTPGQRLFGLSVRQDHDLSPPTLAQALVWTVLFWLSLVVFMSLPFALALVTARHRAGHDIFSGLVVIRQPQISY